MDIVPRKTVFNISDCEVGFICSEHFSFYVCGVVYSHALFERKVSALTRRIKMNKLRGIHHVTAITSSAEKNYEFFTYVLGMRLVKKTVNQDDIRTYHLFFADDEGSPGTDMTFFDFPGIPKGVHGTNEISNTSFRVPSNAALDYWVKRFERLEVKHHGIKEQFGKKVLPFVDFDDQQYQLISDEDDSGVATGTPWKKGPIPLEYAVTGLGPIFVRVNKFDSFKESLEEVFLFKEMSQFHNCSF